MGSSASSELQAGLEMGKGQNEGVFSEEQIQMYKDCFKLMDINKGGTIDKNDLRGAFDNVGVLMSEGELDSLLGEISGPCTPDNMIAMFQEKMAGEGNDADDVIVQAFSAYEADKKIDSKMFTHALMTWGDKMTKAEIDDVFDEFEIDEDYMIKSKDVIGLFVAVKEEEKKRLPHPLPRRPLPSLRMMERPRRRRRRRRRLPSKCFMKTFLLRNIPFFLKYDTSSSYDFSTIISITYAIMQ